MGSRRSGSVGYLVPEAGNYLLAHIGFSFKETPYISLQHNNTFSDLVPLQKILTLRFDNQQRFCVGWRNIAKGERFVCPDHNAINDKYEQCSACRQRTGFNPAFYYAARVSAQQEARNLEPHILYLAHFGSGIVKVGISLAARGKSRLLEQGARYALILDTFPSAHIARHYEARLAELADITETVQLHRKIAALAKDYDGATARSELLRTRARAQTTLGITFTNNKPMALDSVYFPSTQPILADASDVTSQNILSGNVIGMLGSLLYCKQRDTTLFLSLKKYIGYKISLTYEETPVTLPARQMSLF